MTTEGGGGGGGVGNGGVLSIAELEAAASVCMNAATMSAEVRRQAEEILMKFRKEDKPYSLCQQILEQTTNELLLFESVDILKNNIIKNWQYLAMPYILTLRQYLLNYIIIKPNIPVFLREKIIQVIAIMIKRYSLLDRGIDRKFVIDEVDKMLISGDNHQKMISCRLLNAMLQEYMITVKSDDNGMSFEEHYKCKRHFESEHLKHVFITVVHVCSEILKLFDKTNIGHVQVLYELLSVHEQIFSWGYLSPLMPKRAIMAFESCIRTEQTILRLSQSWDRIILDPEILNFFFDMYWKVRDLNDLQQKALVCLYQLSTLTGAIFANELMRVTYFGNYLHHTIQLLSHIQMNSNECIGFANIMRKLFLNTDIENFCKLPIMTNVLQHMFTLTCKFAEGAVEEECKSTDDPVYLEALNKILEAWLLIVQAKNINQPLLVQQMGLQIFHKYLQCQLAPPDGLRRTVDSSVRIDDIDECDREKYKEQLIIIGTLGRLAPVHAIQIVCRVLEDKLRKLNERLLYIYSDLNNIRATNRSNLLDDLFEDIHWILMIGGHLLAMDGNGEVPLIPNEIMECSTLLLQNGQINIPTTLFVLGATNQNICDIPNGELLTDPVIRLIAAVLRLCELENKAIEAKIFDFLSPEVCKTIMWFLQIWSDSYLLFSPQNYQSISEVINLAFGLNRPGGVWTTNFLLNKIYVNVNNLGTDKSIVKHSIGLFTSLVKRPEKVSTVYNSEYFKEIFKLINMPYADSKSELIKGLLTVIACIQDNETRARYTNEILDPIVNKFENIGYRRINVIKSNELIQSFNLIKACTVSSTGQLAVDVYCKFERILTAVPKILLTYFEQSMIVAVFELMIANIQNMIHIERNCIIDICRNISRTYKNMYDEKHNFFYTSTEDDYLETILLLLDLMNGLILKHDDKSKSSGSGGGGGGGGGGSGSKSGTGTDVTDVCYSTLKIIIPLTKTNFINYPTFTMKYYETVTFFFDINTDTIADFPQDFLTQIFESYEIGLRFCGSEIQSFCFDFIRAVATYFSKLNKCEKLIAYTKFLPFFKLTLRMIIFQEVHVDNKNECAKALLSLIICYKGLYQTTVNEVIADLPSPLGSTSHVDRISGEFEKLTKDFTYVNNRQNQLKFMDNFNQFMVNINFMFD